jgi:hypothetical protein
LIHALVRFSHMVAGGRCVPSNSTFTPARLWAVPWRNTNSVASL